MIAVHGTHQPTSKNVGGRKVVMLSKKDTPLGIQDLLQPMRLRNTTRIIISSTEVGGGVE